MWTQKKLYQSAAGTRILPSLHVSPAGLMFSPAQGSEVSESLLSNFIDEDDRVFVACILGGLVPVQVSQRKVGLDDDVRVATQFIWSVILQQFQGINKVEGKKHILCRFAHDYLPTDKVKSCAKLLGVLSSSPVSRPKYFDELAQLWNPHLENEEELNEVVYNLASHGMVEVDPKNCCVRVPIPIVLYYRSLLSVDESISVYDRFLSPTASTLHKAALHDYLEVAKHILEKDSSHRVVDARDSGNWTPLLFAAQNASYDIMKLLIQKGANVNAVESSLQTALHRACASGSLSCVKLLLENGASKNQLEREGIPPIAVAIGENRRDVVDYLLAQGAKIPEKFKQNYQAYLDNLEDE